MFNDKILKLSLIFLGVLVVFGFITIGFVMDSTDSKPTYTSSPKEVKVTNISTDPKELNLDTIFINIKSEKFKILKVDIAVRMKSVNDRKALEKNMDNVRNVLLQYLASMDANRIGSPKGKEDLKEDLKEVLEDSFGYRVESIYWKNFILSP